MFLWSRYWFLWSRCGLYSPGICFYGLCVFMVQVFLWSKYRFPLSRCFHGAGVVFYNPAVSFYGATVDYMIQVLFFINQL